METETEREKGREVGGRGRALCYLRDRDDVMEEVELSSDWLAGCGGPFPEKGGGR